MDKPNVAVHAAAVAALERAILEGGGTQAALAERLGKFLNRPSISQQTISKWLKDETLLDAIYWPAIEWATDGKVTRAHLRIDVFAPQQIARAARG